MLVGFEAMILHEYYDVAGIETVCVGHVVKPEDQVWLRDGVTRDECLGVLKRDVATRVASLNRLVKVELTRPMVDALISLIFNIGVGDATHGFTGSTVLRLLNDADYAGAADAFLMWRYAMVKQKDGTYQKRPVLLGRREAEASLFRSGIASLHSAEPSLESLLARAQADIGSGVDLGIDWSTGSHRQESNDELTADGRLIALPPSDESV